MPIMEPRDLETLAARIFGAVGVAPDDARWVATLLVRANLRGHDSHGVIRIPQYVKSVQDGQTNPYSGFEEPVYGNDARLLASLRRQTRIPIAAGQNEGHKWRHRELLVHEAVDILQPNVVWVGGYTEAVKVAAMAQSFNLPVANGGGWPHHNMHLIAGVANGWRVEFHLLMWLTGEMVFRNPPSPVQGMVTLPEQPGLGLEPNDEVLRDSEER